MNKPKSNSINKATGIRIYSHMRFNSLYMMNPKRKNFGRPVRKHSRVGKPSGLNKVGHRNNTG